MSIETCTTTVVPGNGLVHRGQRTVLVLPTPVPRTADLTRALIGACTVVTGDPSGRATVLAVAGLIATGGSSLPAFCLGLDTDQGLVVVLHEEAEAEVRRPGEAPVRLSGHDGLAWVERRFRGEIAGLALWTPERPLQPYPGAAPAAVQGIALDLSRGTVAGCGALLTPVGGRPPVPIDLADLTVTAERPACHHPTREHPTGDQTDEPAEQFPAEQFSNVPDHPRSALPEPRLPEPRLPELSLPEPSLPEPSLPEPDHLEPDHLEPDHLEPDHLEPVAPDPLDPRDAGPENIPTEDIRPRPADEDGEPTVPSGTGPAAALGPHPAPPAADLGAPNAIAARGGIRKADPAGTHRPDEPIRTPGGGVALRLPNLPPIEGVLCARGHFTDPFAAYCAICGLSMQQVSRQITRRPRPPLGILMLDDGTAVTLDGDLVIGRAPGAHPAVLAGRARPLLLNDDVDGVSRIHARITLVEWSVRLSDESSSNGTYLGASRAGQAVPTGQAVELDNGAVIRIGRRHLTFDAFHGPVG